MRDDTYWATLDGRELGLALSTKVDEYTTGANNGPLKSVVGRNQRAYSYYFGLDPSGVHATSQVLRGGDQGELAMLRVNHSRPLVNTLLNLIVAPKIVWTPKAVNVDYDSVRECELAAAVLEYYWSEKEVSSIGVRALEEALVFAEGFVHAEWDELGGEINGIDPDAADGSGAPTTAGDVLLSLVQAWDLIRDPNKSSYEALDWLIVRARKSKWNLAARYPDQRDVVLHASSTDVSINTPGSTDDVLVYYFYHKRTAAVPEGRAVVFLQGGDVLGEPGPLPYDDLPVYRVSAGETTGTPYGYTAFYEILGIQEMMDSLHTSVATNQSSFGTQNIAMQAGSEVSIDELAAGMRAITYPVAGSPPVALQLLKTPPEIFTYLAELKKDEELCFGLNSVVRGEPQSGEQSGSALALLQTQALQQASVIQGSYLKFVRSIGAGLLDLISKRLSGPAKVAITGVASRFLVRDTEYTSNSFGRIKQVQVEIGNPSSQTHSGRLEIAKDLMSQGFIKTPEQYLQVLETGQIKPLTDALNSQLLLIKSENEQLAQGVEQPVILLDDHMLHCREHAAVLANPEARANPEIVKAILDHITQHSNIYAQVSATNPLALMMSGQTPAPPGLVGGAPPPGPGMVQIPDRRAPPGPAPSAPPGNPNAGRPTPPAGPPPPPPAREPTNPVTKQKWNPADGGGAVPPPVPPK